MKIREIMTTDVATAAPDTTLEEIATMMKDQDVGAIPIVEDDELCGIVTDRDIVVRCIAEGRHPADTRVEDILSEDLHTVQPEMDVAEAADLMSRHQVRRLPVVEEGRLIGMLAIGDVAVKQGDDTRSGDTLEGISRGVKQSRSAKPDVAQSRKKAASAPNIRAPKKTGTAGSDDRAGRMQQQGLRSHKNSGTTGRSSSRSAASRGINVKPNRQGITNRSAGEELDRNSRVVPIRESRSSARKPSTRKKAG